MSNGRVAWLTAGDFTEPFPPVADALREPDGLLAAGGDLSSPRLLSAYRHGIFPWYDEGQPLLWWSPDPRCVIRPGDLHVARRLRRELRRSPREIRINTVFGDVMRACAGPRRHETGTWITQNMLDAYQRLHEEGWAHSIEIWEGNDLVGGLYGLAIGRAFFGESMFSRVANASKITLVLLDRLLASEAFGLLDCQLPSHHLMSMGAVCIPRAEFVDRLETLCNPPAAFGAWPGTPLPVRELVK